MSEGGLFPGDPMALKRPSKTMLQRFTLAQVGNDDVREYLRKGFSLVICCKDCPRLIEWTPPELERRFGDQPELKIASIGARLKCSGDGGCGSEDVAVYPHPYDRPWTWPRN